MVDIKIEESLGNYLHQKGLYVATAESCTGGLIADRITNIPGSSKYYLGGMVTYSYESKMKWLGVKPKTLTNFGAVSKETVQEMALGLVQVLHKICEPSRLITIAVSGIAGPDGGTSDKPVGSVWIAWSFNSRVKSSFFLFHGDRISIKTQSASQALDSALRWIQEECGSSLP